MNVAEKRRAEEMVKALKVVMPEAPTPEPPARLTAALAKAVGDLRAAGFRVNRGNEITVECPSEHPALVAHRKSIAEITARRSRRVATLIAQVWNNDFTFETLQAELERKHV